MLLKTGIHQLGNYIQGFSSNYKLQTISKQGHWGKTVIHACDYHTHITVLILEMSATHLPLNSTNII